MSEVWVAHVNTLDITYIDSLEIAFLCNFSVFHNDFVTLMITFLSI